MIQRLNSFLEKEGYTISKIERNNISDFMLSVIKKRNNINPFEKIGEWVNNKEADKYLSVGDKIYIPELKIPENKSLGIEYKTLKNVEVNVISVLPNKVLFNFEDCLFSSCMDEEVKYKTFEETSLFNYLNNEFICELAQAIQKAPTSCSLLSRENIENMEFFSKTKNRIKTLNNEIFGWWLSSGCNDSSNINFAYVTILGNFYYNTADNVSGCSPAFYIG